MPATRSATTCTRSSRRRSRSPTRPNMASSTAPPKWRRSATLARQRGLALPHGRRAARQCAGRRTGESLADVTWRAGVDALSFGFVKNGGLNAEALILFRTELADEIAVRRKRAGHLLSKGRYLAAQLLAMLDGDLWLDNARAANAGGAEARRGGAATGWSIRSRRTRSSSGSAPTRRRGLRAPASTSTTGDRARSGWSRAGTSGPRSIPLAAGDRRFINCDGRPGLRLRTLL